MDIPPAVQLPGMTEAIRKVVSRHRYSAVLPSSPALMERRLGKVIPRESRVSGTKMQIYSINVNVISIE